MVFLQPSDLGYAEKLLLYLSAFVSDVCFQSKTLGTLEGAEIDRGKWCSVSPTASVTAMPPSPTSTGLSKSLVNYSRPTYLFFEIGTQNITSLGKPFDHQFTLVWLVLYQFDRFSTGFQTKWFSRAPEPVEPADRVQF